MITLYNHQKQALNHLITHKQFGLFMEQGTGKTIPMLTHITNLLMARINTELPYNSSFIYIR